MSATQTNRAVAHWLYTLVNNRAWSCDAATVAIPRVGYGRAAAANGRVTHVPVWAVQGWHTQGGLRRARLVAGWACGGFSTDAILCHQPGTIPCRRCAFALGLQLADERAAP